MTEIFDFASVAALFEPITVRGMTLANRFVMPPMTRSQSPEGVPGEPVQAYYRRRAAGETGLIVTEGVGIDHPAALGSSVFDGVAVPFMHGEASLEGWRKVVAGVHAEGGKIVPQLWHQGVMRPDGTGPFPDHPSSRPSGIWGPVGRKASIPPEAVEKLSPPTKALSESEIGDIIAAFGRSAAHAKDVGFDGIAIHGAHGYLLDTFLWSETNQRTDAFGGDHVARTRFGVEVVKAIRVAVGEELPIMLRFSQWKQQDFDAVLAETPDQLGEILGPLSDAGVDIFDASTRVYSMPAFEGSPLNLAGWAKKLTGKVSATVGGIGLTKDLYSSLASGCEAAGLEDVVARLEKGEFDLIAIGRGLIADPDLVKKVREGAPRKGFHAGMLRELI